MHITREIVFGYGKKRDMILANINIHKAQKSPTPRKEKSIFVCMANRVKTKNIEAVNSHAFRIVEIA